MADRTESTVLHPSRSPRRWARVALHHIKSRTTLSQRFIVLATLLVTTAVSVLGQLTVLRLEHGITRGVALTAASSIDALIGHEISTIDLSQPLSEDRRARLYDVFSIGNGSETTRLMQIRLFDLNGTPRYEASEVFDTGPPSTAELQAAVAGRQLVAKVVDVQLEGVGPVPPLPVKVLEIVTVVHDRSDNPIGVAQLYLGANSLMSILDETRWQAWLIVGGIGAAIMLALYQLVDVWSRMIANQRRRLEENLARSRRLSRENQRLHAASEQLRIEAGLANENLLAKVGADIHDGPIQLLALLILRLSHKVPRESRTAEELATERLAAEAMEELRNISTGLVLPELAELTLDKVLALAVTRHENGTGTKVTLETADLTDAFPLNVRICAYRVVQEALINAFRHAGAVGQKASAWAESGTLTLVVSNAAGKGTGPVRASSGLGLKGMRFRVQSLGGTLEVDFGPEQTKITARIPYRSDTNSGASTLASSGI